MRIRILIVALFVTGGLVYAVSKPTSNPDRAPGQPAPSRDIRLVGPPAGEPALVSDLEAGRGRETPLPRRGVPIETVIEAEPELAAPSPEAPLIEARLERVIAAVAERMPAAAGAETDALVLEPIIRAPNPSAVTAAAGGLAPDFEAGFDARPPVILIRGGRGGVHDDCDLHRPRGRRSGPIAVNQTTPPFRGLDGRVPPIGIRPAGMASFPRRGIR